jgi:hypothetical protein
MIRASDQRGLWELISLEEAKAQDRRNGVGPFELTMESLIPRHMNCSNYDLCLNFAAERRWSSFSCEGCRKTKHGRFEEERKNL